MAKRIFLFLAVNILVVVTISIVLRLFGLDTYFEQGYGIDYQKLLGFCLVWGFGGAFISLLISKPLAKWSMGVKKVDLQTSDPHLRELLTMVQGIAQKAGLKNCPEVGIYESEEVNAFATGATKNSSLVAVSSGLLRRMNRAEVEGVLAHEVGHIANGDMVTITLIQGVINAFVMFFARVAAHFIASSLARENERPSPWIRFGVTIAFEMVFGLLGAMVVAAFSRHREFRADRASALLVGKEKMILALQSLRSLTGMADDGAAPQYAVMKISSQPSRFFKFLSSHPPLEDRIAALSKA